MLANNHLLRVKNRDGKTECASTSETTCLTLFVAFYL